MIYSWDTKRYCLLSMSSIHLFERSQIDNNNKKKNNLSKCIACTSITSFAYNKKNSIGVIFFDFYLAYAEEFEDKWLESDFSITVFVQN
jgi:hypothetical protein